MSERIHALAQLLPGKNSLDECSVDELEHLTKRYPFFAPAQFLLLQKLKTTGSPDAAAQQQKAVLYYHDPLQFKSFVSSEKFFVDDPVFPQNDTSFHNNNSPETDELRPAENLVADEKAFLQRDTDDENGTTVSEAIQQPIETTEIKPEEEPPTVVSPPSEVREVEVHRQEHSAVEEYSTSDADTTEEVPEEEKHEQESTTDNPQANTELTPEEHSATLPQQASASSPEAIAGVGTAPALKKESDVLAFEPFHTVDYFASQGIKISAEELPKDKLTKQVRSFTEWLKVMKRLPAVEMAKSPESPAEKNVETLASHSVEGSDVVTEAMAEVWAKQGNRAKAIETYNKLSLLNPSKKTYFATKIENLKGS